MRERTSLNHGLLQIQYAFLELPKVPKEKPKEAGAALWAWLFVHAPTLSEIPDDLPDIRYREALSIANQMTFTKDELEAYHKAVDEIEQLRVLIDAKWVEGHKAGVVEGHKAGAVEGKTSAIFTIFAARGMAVSDAARTRILACNDIALLEQWIGLAISVASVDELIA